MAASSQHRTAQCPGLNQFSKDNVDDEFTWRGQRQPPYTIWGTRGLN